MNSYISYKGYIIEEQDISLAESLCSYSYCLSEEPYNLSFISTSYELFFENVT